MEPLSSRVSGLSRESQARYRTKVIAAGLLVDPYEIDEWTASPDEIPDVKSSDMIIYMISTPSPTTQHIWTITKYDDGKSAKNPYADQLSQL